jgi:dTDP-4-dehydrorhamnose reductase
LLPVKIFATGADGMVGAYLPEGAIKTDVSTLDVTDRARVSALLEEHKPDVVFHLGAETNVDLCEVEPDRGFRINALGTRNVALECAAQDIQLVYVSTAAVFGGEKHDPYNEFDTPNPANLYGQSKLAGEIYVKQFCPHSWIVRAGWMIGGGPTVEKKFIAKMLERAEATGKIMAVDDKWGSPVYAKQFVQALINLAQQAEFGTYHVVNEGYCTRYDIARVVNDEIGSPYEVLAVSSAQFPLAAPRGRSEALDNMLLRLHGWDWMEPWEDAVRGYLREEWSHLRTAAGTQPESA